MSSNNKKPARRKYFIHKEFQAAMIMKLVSLLIVMALFSSLTLFFLADSELETQYNEAHTSIISMRDTLLGKILVTNFVSVLIIAVATAYVTLRSSHKIAGPLYKVEKVINDITNGNLTMEVCLREADQLKSLGNALDTMVRSLSGKLHAIRSVSDDISRLDDTIQDLYSQRGLSDEKITEIFDSIRINRARLTETLDKFNLR